MNRVARTGSVSDPYYGQEEIAKLCARFITHLFGCTDFEFAPTGSFNPAHATPLLTHFIAYVINQARLPSTVTFTALAFLERLQARVPAIHRTSGHRLFIVAFMIAAKVLDDDEYNNVAWALMAQKLFALAHLNTMEREFCAYLDWDFGIGGQQLMDIEARIRMDFSGSGPYSDRWHTPFTRPPYPATKIPSAPFNAIDIFNWLRNDRRGGNVGRNRVADLTKVFDAVDRMLFSRASSVIRLYQFVSALPRLFIAIVPSSDIGFAPKYDRLAGAVRSRCSRRELEGFEPAKHDECLKL